MFTDQRRHPILRREKIYRTISPLRSLRPVDTRSRTRSFLCSGRQRRRRPLGKTFSFSHVKANYHGTTDVRRFPFVFSSPKRQLTSVYVVAVTIVSYARLEVVSAVHHHHHHGGITKNDDNNTSAIKYQNGITK